MLGNASVGKTSIISRQYYGKFAGPITSTVSTAGVEMVVHTCGKAHPITVWDTAGEERYQSITPAYVRGSSIIIVVYSLTDSASFASVPKWLDIANANSYNAPIVVFGNKADEESHSVPAQDAERFCGERKLQHLMGSAKTGQNVEQLFDLAVTLWDEGGQPLPAVGALEPAPGGWCC
jgi:small GTP-binding protein